MVGTVAPVALARSTYIRYSTKVVKGRSIRFKMAMAALNRSLPPADKNSRTITLIPYNLTLYNMMKNTCTATFTQRNSSFCPVHFKWLLQCNNYVPNSSTGRTCFMPWLFLRKWAQNKKEKIKYGITVRSNGNGRLGAITPIYSFSIYSARTHTHAHKIIIWLLC
jgi:hypothetical protein